jgi:PAS domain S-box-containing protein
MGAIHSMSEWLERVFDLTNDAVFIVDPAQNRIVDANKRSCELLGYSKPELLALPISAVHPNDLVKMRDFAEAVLKDREAWTDELCCVTKSGDTLLVEITGNAIEIDGQTYLLSLVKEVTELNRLRRHSQILEREVHANDEQGMMVGVSPQIQQIRKLIDSVAPTDASVLICGESGTGKELVARAIHEKSGRRDQLLVRVNCAAIPEHLFESEFFGHARGAFTHALHERIGRFELADGGTLFLDEIGDIPVTLQGKFLRVLQESQFERVGDNATRSVDVRIIAATNRDLKKDAASGRFREDLYYRLAVFPIEVPPLRDRREDVPVLARHFLAHAARRRGVEPYALTLEEAKLLESYSWPGNVRELQNTIERATILSDGVSLTLPRLEAGEPGRTALNHHTLTLEDIKNLERQTIVRALEKSNWKIRGDDGAATKLGVPPTTLSSRIKSLGIARNG